MDDRGSSKSWQAYQVLGTILMGDDSDQFSHEQEQMILDYFSECESYDATFLVRLYDT